MGLFGKDKQPAAPQESAPVQFVELNPAEIAGFNERRDKTVVGAVDFVKSKGYALATDADLKAMKESGQFMHLAEGLWYHSGDVVRDPYSYRFVPYVGRRGTRLLRHFYYAGFRWGSRDRFLRKSS